MSSAKPTIREVAAKAQVSVATVSRVLNESGYADRETRARVLKAAAALNYQRNVNWSRLKSQSSQTILFLLGNRQASSRCTCGCWSPVSGRCVTMATT